MTIQFLFIINTGAVLFKYIAIENYVDGVFAIHLSNQSTNNEYRSQASVNMEWQPHQPFFNTGEFALSLKCQNIYFELLNRVYKKMIKYFCFK